MNVPETVGVPLMVIVLPNQIAVTPAGKPLGVPMPVAPVVVWVISVSAVLGHKVGVLEAALTVLFAGTVMVPVAFTNPQPSINGIL